MRNGFFFFLMDEALLGISLAGRGQFEKMLILVAL